MRKRYLRRQLVALGHVPFSPTDAQRHMVRVLAFNDVPEERIATAIGVSLTELRYFFATELDYSRDEILATCAANVLDLANQRLDLGVALRASELVLKTRLRSWREPKPLDDVPPPRVEDMSLQEVEDEIARLEARRRDAAEPAETQANAPGAEDIVH